MIGSAPYLQTDWQSLLPWVGIGGTLLFLSAILYFVAQSMSGRARADASRSANSRSVPRPWRELSAWLAALLLLSLAVPVVSRPAAVPGRLEAFPLHYAGWTGSDLEFADELRELAERLCELAWPSTVAPRSA